MESSLRRYITGHSVQGARHIQNGTPCQDAVFVEEDEDIVILCASDGHGDKKHARSDEGAQAAVEITAALMKQALQDLRMDKRPMVEKEIGIREHLPRRISWEWNRRVQNSKEGYWSKEVVLYGCTVLAAAIAPEMSIFLQLGDGDMLFIDEDGTPEFIFHPDEDMYGTVTHSLCQPNSAQFAKLSVRTLPNPKLLLISTDGLRDSLQDNAESYINVGRWLLNRFTKEGFPNLKSTLPAWLSKISFQGNGDDTTMGILIWNKEKSQRQSQKIKSEFKETTQPSQQEAKEKSLLVFFEEDDIVTEPSKITPFSSSEELSNTRPMDEKTKNRRMRSNQRRITVRLGVRRKTNPLYSRGTSHIRKMNCTILQRRTYKKKQSSFDIPPEPKKNRK